MFAIPLPFVVSLMLLILAFFLWGQAERNARAACVFVLICASATTIVGLRWSLDWQILKLIQPVVASLVPIGAWYCFRQVHLEKRDPWHLAGPAIILMGSLTYPLMQLPVDYLLVALYLGYGLSLLRSQPKLAADVPFTYVQQVAHAEKVAGYLLVLKFRSSVLPKINTHH